MMSPLSLGDLDFISANRNWFGWNSMGWYYRPIIIWLAVLYIYPWNHSLASNFTSLYGSRSYCYQAAWSVEVQWWWSPQPLNFLAKSLPWRFKSNCNDKSFLRLNLLFQGLVNQRASLRQQLFGTLEVLLPWRRNCLPALLLFRCVLAIGGWSNAEIYHIQGSGWGWLGYNKAAGKLQIAACANQVDFSNNILDACYS